jgi:hypothetical protein
MKKPSPSNKHGHDRNAGQRAIMQMPADAPIWMPELEKWEQAQYDGIKGILPEWVPEPTRKQFGSTRRRLFFLVEEKQATFAEIRSRFDYLVQNKYGAMVLALIKDTKPYDSDLCYLVDLYQAILLGEIEGLRQLARENAVIGLLACRGHTQRKPNPDKGAIQQIGARCWDNNPNAVPKDILASQEFFTYVKGKKKYATRTYLSWLQQVDPRRKKPGRRPRTR